MYAIVDIETTGGYAARNRITEIAIFIHDGEKIVDEYQTLINPRQPIPGYITGLTGISDNMVESSPEFGEVADQIHDKLKDKIFVAHNVHFDYSFLKREFGEVGLNLNLKKNIFLIILLFSPLLNTFYNVSLNLSNSTDT